MTVAMSLTDARVGLDRASKLDDVLAVVRVMARRMLDAQGATIVLREDGMCFYADEDSMSPLWKGQRFPIDQCISGWAMLHGATVVVPDITVDDRVPQDAYRPTYVASLVMVPIRPHDPLGAIGCYWSRNRTATAQQVAELEVLAEMAATAFERIGLGDAPWAPNFRPVAGRG